MVRYSWKWRSFSSCTAFSVASSAASGDLVVVVDLVVTVVRPGLNKPGSVGRVIVVCPVIFMYSARRTTNTRYLWFPPNCVVGTHCAFCFNCFSDRTIVSIFGFPRTLTSSL